jgi:hypothetical protein
MKAVTVLARYDRCGQKNTCRDDQMSFSLRSTTDHA